jgi:uncharacterized protein YdeI (YjbR/CyaY-like superfamily)
MPTTAAQVDAYLAAAPEFARPILARVRRAFHRGCPTVVETIKWGVPHFEYHGLLGGMAAFKAHVGFGFWRSAELDGFEATFGRPGRASAMGARIERLADLPKMELLVDFVRRAAALNVAGPKARSKRTSTPQLALKMPSDLAAALERSKAAKRQFEAFPPSHRREYLEWILEAKRPETRARRIQQTIEWLVEGKSRNWKYLP